MRRALLVAVLLAALAGCGSASLSARDLRANATVVCEHASERLGRIPQPSSAAAALPFLRRGVAVLGPELGALRRLPPPADLSTSYRATLAEFGTAVQMVDGTIAVLAHGGDAVASFASLEHALGPIVASENTGWRTLQIAACVSR
ncbi:MAG TPA: hypothetical protein VGX45_12855 [Solirubrobacteraceae bacterium]|nr:hypothetical protein [Solirubrobacteraceae bacterium]